MSGLNDIDDIPKAWRAALASIKLSYPEALIAGGALRDREHGVKVKDIDIFVSVGANHTGGSNTIISKLRGTGWPDVQLNGDDSYGDGASERKIVAVTDLTYPGCPPIQLIAMRSFKLEEIDFGICQIMFDGKRIIRLPDYHHDLAAKQFRIIPKMTDAMFVRSLGRWARLKEKYPEWKLHLGSRADDAPFIPPKKPLTFQHIDMPGVTSMQQAMNRFHRGGTVSMKAADFGVRDIPAMMMQPGNYVVPTEIVERLARETTARILSGDRITHTSTIHVDAKSAVPGAQIIADMLAAKQRLAREWENRRKMAIVGGQP